MSRRGNNIVIADDYTNIVDPTASVIGGSNTVIAAPRCISIGPDISSVSWNPTGPKLYLKDNPVTVLADTAYPVTGVITAASISSGMVTLQASGTFTLDTTTNILHAMIDVAGSPFAGDIRPAFQVQLYNVSGGVVVVQPGSAQIATGVFSIVPGDLLVLRCTFISNTTLLLASTAGPTGASVTGPTGSTGGAATGPTGSTGLAATGPTGSTGLAATGPTGSTSLAATGPTGSTGLAATGPTGSTGRSSTGPTGSTGGAATGPTGSTGGAGPRFNNNVYAIRTTANANLSLVSSPASGVDVPLPTLVTNNGGWTISGGTGALVVPATGLYAGTYSVSVVNAITLLQSVVSLVLKRNGAFLANTQVNLLLNTAVTSTQAIHTVPWIMNFNAGDTLIVAGASASLLGSLFVGSAAGLFAGVNTVTASLTLNQIG